MRWVLGSKLDLYHGEASWSVLSVAYLVKERKSNVRDFLSILQMASCDELEHDGGFWNGFPTGKREARLSLDYTRVGMMAALFCLL